jgi:hypothetical protein
LPDINVEILAAVAELVDEATEDLATELGADDALDKDEEMVEETLEDEATEED